MTPTDRRRRILGLALPIIGGMVSQNVVNLVDTAMVGQLGDAALAAVGLGGFITFMSVAFFQGFASSVQAIASRRIGEGKSELAARPLNGALLIAVLAGIPVTALLYQAAPRVVSWLNQDPEVIGLTLPYYQIRLFSIVAVGINFAFRGFWNGTDRSPLYMRTIWLMHGTNIFLNYCLIFGNLGMPAMGVRGAALASTISIYLGSLAYLAMGFKHARQNGYLATRPTRETLSSLLKLLWPAGTQMFLFASGMTVLSALIGLVGTLELAVSSVLINLVLVVVLVEVGFGTAAGALAGQSLGAGKPEEAEAWTREVVRLALMVLTPVCLLAMLLPEQVLRPFLTEPATLAAAILPLRMVAAGLPLDVFGMVYLNALQGVGDTRRVMAVVVGVQWLLFLPATYLIGPVGGHGLVGIWSVFVAYRALQAALLARLWLGGGWQELRV